MPGSFSEVTHDSAKPTEVLVEHENNFWIDCDKHYFSTKLLKNTFE